MTSDRFGDIKISEPRIASNSANSSGRSRTGTTVEAKVRSTGFGLGDVAGGVEDRVAVFDAGFGEGDGEGAEGADGGV